MKTIVDINSSGIKRVFLFILCAMVTSCSIIKPRERVTNVLFLDYRPYLSTGFHISPDSYNQPHNTLGELVIEVYPALKESPTIFVDGIYSASRIIIENVTAEELLEIAVSHAKTLGANGLADLEVKVIYNTTYLKDGSEIRTVSHYEIKGLCIERL